MRRLDIAGRDITWVLKQQLQKNGIQLSLDIADIVKHKVCYVAHDDAYELARPLNDVTTQYVLPDKNVINVGYERFKAPEVIFQPKQLEMNDAVSGISEFVHQAIKTSDVALRGKLAENIVLAGGNTLLKGFEQRLKLEVEALVGTSVKVHAPSNRQYFAWVGIFILVF